MSGAAKSGVKDSGCVPETLCNFAVDVVSNQFVEGILEGVLLLGILFPLVVHPLTDAEKWSGPIFFAGYHHALVNCEVCAHSSGEVYLWAGQIFLTL